MAKPARLEQGDPQAQIAFLEGQLAELREAFRQLEKTFEEVIVGQFAISELRDFWRFRAGVETKQVKY